MIEILKAGFYTSIQDLGRQGFQEYGMPVSGAMDKDVARLANWLVGNSLEEAVLEITLIGPTIKFHKNTQVAITGADINATLDGMPIEMYKTIFVNKGMVLKFGKLISGCRTYLSFVKGFCIPKEMGSYATYAYAKVGGLFGVALKKGDCITLGDFEEKNIKEVPKEFQQRVTSLLAIRVVPGIENSLFDEKYLELFYASEYKISSRSNRMGYRMQGEKLKTNSSVEMISSGVIQGTIQVPQNGQPIILGVDAQTTGGYPRIANVITADMSYLAQQKPGDIIRFRKVALAEAQSLLFNKEKKLELLFKS